MEITGLSLDSQLAILCHVSSHTLLTSVPLICTQWNHLQPYACRQRRTLTLKVHKNYPQSFQTSPPHHYDLYSPPDNAPLILATTFPAITHLFLDHRNNIFGALDARLELLRNWIPTLISFSLYTFPTDRIFIDANGQEVDPEDQVNPQFTAFMVRLLGQLNLMPHLKHLDLTILGPLPSSSLDLQLLHRLTTIKLQFDIHNHLPVSQILKYCSHSTLQHLKLGTFYHFADFLPLLTSPIICSKLEHLKIADHFDSTQLAITFDQCTNLRSLDLTLSTLELYTERLHLLMKLPKLIELSLTLMLLPANENDPFVPVPFAPPHPLPVLSSIHQLNIYGVFFFIPSHEYFVQVTALDQIFPKLQHFRFEWHSTPSDGFICPQCFANCGSQISCIDALLQPLGRLEGLQSAKVWLVRKDGGSVFNWLPRLRRICS